MIAFQSELDMLHLLHEERVLTEYELIAFQNSRIGLD
jgi:hypothetical protein